MLVPWAALHSSGLLLVSGRLMLLHDLLVLLPRPLDLVLRLLFLFLLAHGQLLAISLKLGLETLLFLKFFQFFLLYFTFPLLDLFLEYLLQVLLLFLLTLILSLGDLREPVHGPWYSRPRILKRLFKLLLISEPQLAPRGVKHAWLVFILLLCIHTGGWAHGAMQIHKLDGGALGLRGDETLLLLVREVEEGAVVCVGKLVVHKCGIGVGLLP
jgi:hypothetical protein